MKPIWKSKTFWVNLLGAAVSVAEMSNFVDYLTPEQQTMFTMGLAFANIVLRMVTTKAVTL